MVVKEERNGSRPPVQPQGVKFSVSKRKVLVRRPPLPPKKEKTRGGREEDEEEEQEDVEYVTGFDEKLGLVGKDPESNRRGGVKVVPKLENSWRPEKRMKNIVMQSDVTKHTEETIEMETMAAGPKPDVQYGLTVVTRVQEQTATPQGVAAAAAAPPRRRSPFQEMEDQKPREYLPSLSEKSFSLRYGNSNVSENLSSGFKWKKREDRFSSLFKKRLKESAKPLGPIFKTAVAPVESAMQPRHTVLTSIQEKTATTQGVAARATPRVLQPFLFKDMEDQKPREDLSPRSVVEMVEIASVVAFFVLPLVCKELFTRMGWENGKPTGRNSRTRVTPVEYVRRLGREGLGAAPLPPKENNKKFIKPGEARSNLQQAQQAVAFSREQSKEVCRDSEARNAASSHHGDDPHAQTFKESRELHERRTCTVCYCNEFSMLLLPCLHVCLCKECEKFLDACPLCRSPKQDSLEVYLR